MECFLTFLFIVIFIIAVTGLSSSSQLRLGQRSQAFQRLAQRFSGVCTPGGWFRFPSVRFQYGPTQVLLTVNRTRGPRGGQFTEIWLHWPDPKTACQIVPTSFLSWFRSGRGLRRVFTRSEHFDRRYAVYSNDPADAVSLMSDGVCWQIEQLRHFLGNNEIEVSIRQGRMLVRKRSRMGRYQELEYFTRLVLDLFDQAMLTRCEGIEFVESRTAKPIEEVRCQVCGEDIVTDMVFCRRCKTPHHLDCWQYYGACSVYGCQETQYVTPRVAAAKEKSQE